MMDTSNGRLRSSYHETKTEASMKQNIIHIGLDVDDTQYHGSAFNKNTGEVIDFKSRPTLKGLLQQLDRMARHFKGHKIKLCY